MKVDQYCVLQIFHQQNLAYPQRTKQETFFMYLQCHKTLCFSYGSPDSMARDRRLADCPDSIESNLRITWMISNSVPNCPKICDEQVFQKQRQKMWKQSAKELQNSSTEKG